MPSKSKSQQRLFGMIHAYQKGSLKKAPAKVKSMSSTISPSTTTHFAETKHKGLREHVKKSECGVCLEDKLKKKEMTPIEKKAFDQAFVKTAIENGVEPILAMCLLKEANFGGAVGGAIGGGLGGAVVGAPVGATVSALGGMMDETKKDKEQRDYMRAILSNLGSGAVMGGTLGALGGSSYGGLTGFFNSLQLTTDKYD